MYALPASPEIISAASRIPHNLSSTVSGIFCSLLLLPLITMVVVHAQPSSSVTIHKKNRRKITRKQPRLATSGDHDGLVDRLQDGDENMATSSKAVPEAAKENADDDEVMIDADESLIPQSSAPAFPPLPASAQRTTLKSEMRRIPIPPHRMTPLKKDWVNIFSPLTEMLQLQVRMNVQRRCVEIRVSAFAPVCVLCATNSHLFADIKTYQRNWLASEGR